MSTLFIQHLEDLLSAARGMLFGGCESPDEYELGLGEVLALEHMINNNGDDPLPPDDERMGRCERLYRIWVDRCDRFEIAYMATRGQPFGFQVAPEISKAALEAIHFFERDAREDWIREQAAREEIRRDEASLEAARCLQAIEEVSARPWPWRMEEEPNGE